MTTRFTRLVSAFRTIAVLASILAVLPNTSGAIQLHWSSGTTNLSFSQDTRATLIVQADSAEATLPGQWRLLWTADSSGIQFVAPESLIACQTDTAKVSAIDPPNTPADSAANQITAHFCSDGEASATIAHWTVDLIGGSQGKLKVVALDLADSNSVIESNEVTYNGGVDGEYAPALLRVSSTHETALLEVTAVGAGLSAVQSVKVGAADDVWSVPLTIVQQADNRLVATADVYAALPQAVVRARGATGASGSEVIPADEIHTDVVTSAGSDTIFYWDPNPRVYPHDFAFHYNSVPNPTDPVHPWKGVFHLFYIRVVRASGADSIIAHAWTDSLGKPWSVDTLAFRPSGHGWDKMKVWAPSIQQVGNLTYMFYTGVDSLGNQSIGYATTAMLGTTNISWARSDTAVYKASNTDWAQPAGVVQFRDPFIMPDPDVATYPGRYLLFNTGRDKAVSTYYTIGVARNEPGTMGNWRDQGNYQATDHAHLSVPGALESPLVVRDSLTGAWRMFVANASYDNDGYFSTIFLTQYAGDSLTDRRASEWPQRDSLYHYLDDDADVIGWQACEHLQVGQVHFFAAYEGAGIGITRMHWDPVAQKFIFVHPDVTAVSPGTEKDGLRFFLSELRPGSGSARFVVDARATIAPRLVVYDISGRRVRELMDGRSVRGQQIISWDLRDVSGSPVSTGMYFARLTGIGRAQVVRVPIVR